MIKCVDKGIYTCISRSGIPKKKYTSDNDAIYAAKFQNIKFPNSHQKLVAYKCSHCFCYHLTTKSIKQN